MLRSIIVHLGKKYVVESINDLLEKYKDDMTSIVEIISVWIKRL